MKRHRLNNSEILEVILGLRLRLLQLLEERKDPEKAEIGLRCLHRFLEENPGRPKYQEFSWDLLEYNVVYGEEHILARIEEIKRAQRTSV